MKKLSKDEKLVRMVRTEILTKCLKLWNDMSGESRATFREKTDPNADAHMEVIEREVKRRENESGLDILTALLNGEQR